MFDYYVVINKNNLLNILVCTFNNRRLLIVFFKTNFGIDFPKTRVFDVFPLVFDFWQKTKISFTVSNSLKHFTLQWLFLWTFINLSKKTSFMHPTIYHVTLTSHKPLLSPKTLTSGQLILYLLVQWSTNVDYFMALAEN